MVRMEYFFSHYVVHIYVLMLSNCFSKNKVDELDHAVLAVGYGIINGKYKYFLHPLVVD